MTSIVIAGYLRSPFQFARKGGLINLRPDDLAAQVLRGLVERLDLNPALLEDVIMGCAYPEGEQGTNVARIASFRAGFPDTLGGVTLNRFCGSSMTAIHFAAGQLLLGAGEAYIAAGVESMTRVPMGGFTPSPNPTLLQAFPEVYMAMGHTAEEVARRYEVSREDQDALAGLNPAFGGVVTAGTSSPLTDGSAAVLVCTEDFARRHNLPMLARIKATAVGGCAPKIMGMGPVEATRKVLARGGLTINDVDLMEINEAFSSQSLACLRELGMPLERVNLDGGALALGHPLGATGARITGKAAALLKRTGGRYAVATQCIAGGQGVATLLESVE